jgi:hypothetical protein
MLINYHYFPKIKNVINLFCLFNWLDTKLEITPAFKSNSIKKSHSQSYVIRNFFVTMYYENIDFLNRF